MKLMSKRCVITLSRTDREDIQLFIDQWAPGATEDQAVQMLLGMGVGYFKVMLANKQRPALYAED